MAKRKKKKHEATPHVAKNPPDVLPTIGRVGAGLLLGLGALVAFDRLAMPYFVNATFADAATVTTGGLLAAGIAGALALHKTTDLENATVYAFAAPFVYRAARIQISNSEGNFEDVRAQYDPVNVADGSGVSGIAGASAPCCEETTRRAHIDAICAQLESRR